MSIIVFLFMNCIIIVSSFFITYKLLRLSNFVDSIICWFILYFAQIVSTELILGIFGILYLHNVILLNLLILLIIWSITRDKESSFSFKGIRDTLIELLSNKVILLGACLILGFGLVKIAINLINPPFGWDDLNYHFTFPVEWVKHGNLDIPITISDDPSPSYYPINGSLYFLWLMLPLKNVFIADLGQIPFFILGFLAVYSLATKLNLSKEYSFLAASLFTLIPNYFKHMKLAYVDAMVAALFLVCLNYLFILRKEFSKKSILIFSLTFGLLLGTKTIALLYCVLLFIPFVYLCFKNIGKTYKILVLSVLLIFILGGFSYVRNFLHTGNPLYPLDFKLSGKTIFKGVMSSDTYRAHFKIDDYRLSKLLFHEGLGVQSIIFILPAVFLGSSMTFIKRRKSLDFILLYFLILPLLIYLVYRYLIPLANTRYLYNLLGIGIIIGFYTLSILSVPRHILNLFVIISILASITELAKREELVISIVVTLILLFLLPFFIKRALYIYLLLIFVICLLPFLQKDYIKNEYSRYIKSEKYSGFWPDATLAWDWLNKNTQGNNIAYIGRPVPFPLYGTNFKNNVYYVSVNKTEPVKLHYFANSRYNWGYDFLSLHNNLEAKGNYRSDADYSIWLNNLSRRNTDYLFIYSLHQTKEIGFPLEDNWAKTNPNKFIPVFTNETIHIYKIFK